MPKNVLKLEVKSDSIHADTISGSYDDLERVCRDKSFVFELDKKDAVNIRYTIKPNNGVLKDVVVMDCMDKGEQSVVAIAAYDQEQEGNIIHAMNALLSMLSAKPIEPIPFLDGLDRSSMIGKGKCHHIFNPDNV